MKSKKGLQLLLLSLGMLFAQSCVDDKYNLDNLPDHVILAGDSLILPLGKADTVFLKKLMNDKDQGIDTTILKLEGDVYYLNQQGSIGLTMPSENDIKINDPQPVTTSLAISKSFIVNTPLPADVSQTGNGSNSLTISNSNMIERIDEITFKPGAQLKFDFSFNGIQISNYDVAINIDLPDQFKLTGVTGKTITLNSLTSKSFTIEKMVKTNDDPISLGYSMNLTLKKGCIINYTGSNPSLNIKVSASNLKVGEFKGKINYNGSKSGIRADISKIYNLFKNNEDIISLYSPQLILNTESNIGIPFAVTLKAQALKTGISTPLKTDTTIFNIDAPGTTQHIISNKELNWSDFIKTKPDLLSADIDFSSFSEANGWGSRIKPHFISFLTEPKGKVDYQFKIPLSFAKDFALNYSDTIDFESDDIKDYFFNDGAVEITGDVVSNLPLNAEITAIILSKDKNQSVTIKNNNIIYGVKNSIQKSPIKITLTAAELNQMANPRYLKLAVKLTSSTSLEGISLKQTDFLFIENIKLVKTGGVKVSTK